MTTTVVYVFNEEALDGTRSSLRAVSSDSIWVKASGLNPDQFMTELVRQVRAHQQRGSGISISFDIPNGERLVCGHKEHTPCFRTPFTENEVLGFWARFKEHRQQTNQAA